MVLLNFQPTNDIEINIFFAARMVFFLMLLIDYAQVSYYNNGIERFVGVLGLLVAITFSLVDFCGLMKLLVLETGNNGYIITGNSNNFLASAIKPFSAQSYVFISWFSVMIVLGFEFVNSGVRAIPVRSTKVKGTKTA